MKEPASSLQTLPLSLEELRRKREVLAMGPETYIHCLEVEYEKCTAARLKLEADLEKSHKERRKTKQALWKIKNRVRNYAT